MPLINYIGNRQECLGDTRARRGNAPPPIFLDYLVVGGGSFGQFAAGGGGGLQSGSIRLLPRFTMDVTVGAGGIATGSIETSIPAEPSLIEIPASDFFVYAGNGTLEYSGTPQFNGPGQAITVNYSRPGAGGSAATGSDSTNSGATGGAGGSGSMWINNMYYAGGGGGLGVFFIPGQGVGGAGGIGGGGAGSGFTTAAANGAPNTGGGAGGGTTDGSNSQGGSGVVILRYTSGSVIGAIGGTVEITGSNVYHIFTGSGQFIYQP